MKTTRPAGALVALLVLFLLASPPALLLAGEVVPDRLQQEIVIARDRVYPALVNIGVVSRSFRSGRAVRAPSAGSGVIVSDDGHVLTNFHVAEDATRLTCLLPSGEKIDADVVVHDPLTDLSVLKLRLATRKDPSVPLPVAVLGDSGKLSVGDHVLAMGNPGANSNVVTLGIVANANRVFKSFTGSSIETMELSAGQLTGIFTNWIQHDALIQPGNSGGPLVNLQGEVVGINELGGGGMGFAIPSNLASWVLDRAVKEGKIDRGWFGVTVHPTGEIDLKEGALVSSVLPDGPAASAGIRPGDLLLNLDGVCVNCLTFEGVPALYAQIAALPIGKPVPAVIRRGEETKTVEVVPTRMEPYLGDEAAFEKLGISAMNVTEPMAFQRRYPDARGVVVTRVRHGFPAEVAKPQIEPGDVLLELAGEAVEGLEGLEALQGKHGAKKDLAVRFRRDKRDMITVLDMTKKPEDKRSAELPRAWLGIQTQVLTPEIAKALGHPDTKGYRISWVLPGTEAEKAGLTAGDLVTALDGDPLPAVRLQDAEMLRRRIEDMDIGAEAVFSVIRGGKPIEVKVVLQETPNTASDAKRATDDFLEYGVRELTYMDLVDRELPLDQKGVLVASVENGGWAAVSGLRVGDVVLSLQDEAVSSVADFEARTKAVTAARPKHVKIFVRRGVSTAFVFILPEWPAK
jgi:serine protease Do